MRSCSIEAGYGLENVRIYFEIITKTDPREGFAMDPKILQSYMDDVSAKPRI